MRAIQIQEYGGVEVLRLNESAPDPEVGDEDVLVRVHSTSVNPVDAARRAGYGRRVFGVRGGGKMPLILGHDVSGVVAAVGPKVTRFAEGDEVWSAPDAFRAGTYAEFVAVREREVARKPVNLTHDEAASIPYVALTTWSALVGSGALAPETARGKKVLVHAGSGGVGSFAIQLLKAWGATVATTCSTRNVDLCCELGADFVIDYTRQNYASELESYDVVFDTLGYRTGAEQPSLSILKSGANAHYVSIVHPILPWTDRFGLVPGGILAAGALLWGKVRERLVNGRSYHWSLFAPDGAALGDICQLVEEAKIRPLIDAVFELSEVAGAHASIETGRTRGKIVLTVP